ncbi:hypothetical protein ES319_A01G183400v1 [Gossypium barbadense]|uniref:Uncharacterized protein n=2 Tax=Gossypium TaxID=3633 RepID=A0A5J5WY04_GOSBA|nr:hypothetical protein ES319_A01G183400v1 [Gossypium barbadense]TYH31784.1 hypothetical protein ES288_A01G200000v1 [Gossypium darwinii]
MASQTIHHTRSNSFPLPSRPNPLVLEIDEHLNKLRDSEATSTSSSICHKLNGLQDLYDGVDKLLDFPFFQQELAQEQKKGPVDELLDGSLRLFDLIQDIQLVMRRRGCGEVELVGEVRKYFTSRKVVQKTIYKALKNVKRVETKCIFSSLNDHETKAMYLFTLISRPKERLKCGSWALVSKLLHHNWIGCEQARRRDINEFENVDAALRSVMSQKMSKSENVEMPRQLKELELCVQELEDGLECLFKCIIKAKVSLLNAFNR